uniref:Uncharacterized protein n=1 Tax=Salix viminalis TaxID=40686 RepID=A0A6N2MKF8_SALVM
MPELVYQERSSSRSGFRARDASPDSVILTLESNFSLFSSASASVDRCSFASDAHDHDSLASEISLHLAAGHDQQESSSSGPDRNNNKQKQQPQHIHTRLSRKAENVKAVQKEDNRISSVEDDTYLLDSARSSFSLALKVPGEEIEI